MPSGIASPRCPFTTPWKLQDRRKVILVEILGLLPLLFLVHMANYFLLRHFVGNSSNSFQKSMPVTSGSENVEKQKPSHSASGNTTCCSHCGQEFGSSSKTQTCSQYDPEFLLPEIQHQELIARVRSHVQSNITPNSHNVETQMSIS